MNHSDSEIPGILVLKSIMGKSDILEHARFEDAVAIFPVFLDGFGMMIVPNSSKYYQIPYRMLLPQKVEGLILAGRSTSCERMAYATVRQMAHCALTGQAAGVAAALTARSGAEYRDIDINKLQRALQEQEVRIK